MENIASIPSMLRITTVVAISLMFSFAIARKRARIRLRSVAEAVRTAGMAVSSTTYTCAWVVSGVSA